MTDGSWPRWRGWFPGIGGGHQRSEGFWAGRGAYEVTAAASRDMRARALECNLFVMIPGVNLLVVGADDEDPGPAAPPFADFLRVMGEEGSCEFQYLWKVDLLPEDPRVFFEIAVWQPVQETFLFSFQLPHYRPILERIEHDNGICLSTRRTLKAALTQHAADMEMAIRFDQPTGLGELLRKYEEWDRAGRPRQSSALEGHLHGSGTKSVTPIG